VVTVAVCFAVWLPLHSQQANQAAQGALQAGQGRLALSDAQTAASADPFAVLPLRTLATVYSAFGESGRAQAELVKATTVQPQNPQPWCWLGLYDLQQSYYRDAIDPLRRAVMLDTTDSLSQIALLDDSLSNHPPAASGCVQ
jgi:Flp pilus assembly protein TadD